MVTLTKTIRIALLKISTKPTDTCTISKKRAKNILNIEQEYRINNKEMIIIRKRNQIRRRVRFRCNYCRSSFIAETGEYKVEKLPVSHGVCYTATCPVCGSDTFKIPLF